MTFAPWLLAAALQLAPANADVERYARIAIGIDDAVAGLQTPSPVGLRAVAAHSLATAIDETGLSEGTHAGTEPGGDHGKSLCLFQIHATNPAGGPPEARHELLGLGMAPTARCAGAGVLTVHRAIQYCWKRKYRTHWAAAAASLYATGSRCWGWRGAQGRARLAARVLAIVPTLEHEAVIDDIRTEQG